MGVERNLIRLGDVSVIWPDNCTLLSRPSLKINQRGKDRLFHLFTNGELSQEEIKFIHLILMLGPEEAIDLVTRPFLQVLRPLQALLANSDEPDVRVPLDNHAIQDV